MGWTDLHSAAFDGNVEEVKELLKKGANPNVREKDGDTPLHVAARKGSVDVVELLLKHGADPNILDKYGWTPLHNAAREGHVEVVKLLLEHGADPNIQDEYGDTPLHDAVFKGHVNVVELLLKHGADPNIQNKYGWTPLHAAASEGRVEVVKLLLEHGANPTVKDKYGNTPLDLAREEGYDGVVSLIEERLRRGKRRPQRREAAKARPRGGSQKAVSRQVSTARSPPARSKEARRREPRGAAELVDVVFVERLAGKPITYTPVSFSGSSFNVPELGLSGCVFFRCGAYFCIYRCVLNGTQVAVKVPVQYRADFERDAPPHLTQAPPAVLKEIDTVKALSHRNVLGLAATWPRHGVLAYEWGDGGSLRDQKLSHKDVLKALVHVAWGLRYLHSRGVVHGDLKPENVIVVGVYARSRIWRR